ncbi:MAG: AAA family ATPase [Pirellulaceae bacterium]|nr:AAA family ATPase [Pirellulaceae bacterium]
MKIVRLDLLAYGPFTRESLDFSPAPHGLQLVYGPNEAGKSTSLRALFGLLYGIPNSCKDTFLHAGPDLRIGALLSDEKGSFECIRRRGNKSAKGVLRAADDETLVDPARWEEMLAGLDENAFSQRFGIDYDELVAGGRQVVDGQGDLGQLLFAAASGVANLGNVLRQLDEDAGAIFKAAGRSTPLINKALADLRETKRRINQAELSLKTWKARQDELDVADDKRREIEEALQVKQAEQRRVESYVRVQPDLNKRAQLTREQTELSNVPPLDADFTQRRQKRQDDLIEARTQAASTQRELTAVADELAAVAVPQELLDEETAIRELIEAFGSHKQDMTDRSDLVGQRAQLLRQGAEVRRELGTQEVERLRLDIVERKRIDELATDHKLLVVQVESCGRQLAKVEGEVDRLTTVLENTDPAREGEGLRRTLKRTQPKAEIEAQIDKLGTELGVAERQLTVGLSRLALWSGKREELVRLALPPLESLERLDGELRAAATGRDVVEKELQKLRTQFSELEIEIDQRRRVGQILTLDDLEQARTKRQQGWTLIKQLWLVGDAPKQQLQEFAAQFPEADDTAGAYEASVTRADETSDRMRREASGVAELAGLQTQQLKLIERQALLNRQLTTAENCHNAAEAAWRQLWQPLSITPLSPAEMRGWLARAADLARQAETLQSRQDELARLRASADFLRRELRATLTEAGEAAQLADDPLSNLIDRAEQLAERLTRGEQDRKAWQKQLDALQQQKAEALRELKQAKSAQTQWQTLWQQGIATLGLRADATPAGVIATLSQAEQYFIQLEKAATFEERIAGIDERANVFAHTLDDLIARIAPDLAALSADAAVTELRKRLEGARQSQARRQELQRTKTESLARLEEAQTCVTALQEQLTAMCREARCKQPEELAAVEHQAQRKRQLDDDLRELNDRLYQSCGSHPLDEFISAALAKSRDEWQQELDESGRALKELQQEHTREVEAAQAARSALKLMDGGAAAAQAEEDAQELLARISAHAEQFARLKLASVLLRKAIERYREKNEGPVVTRASELFAELTLGSFTGMKTEFDEKGKPILVGLRPAKDFVPIEGLSDGTRDQLYLALRLASLEVYVREHRPIPFIVDDILVNFDNDRAVAALQALAQLARHTQVIFFTHHKHLLTLAEENLPAGEFIKHRLPGRESAMPAAEQLPLAVG